MATINALTTFGETALTNYLVTGSGQKYLAFNSNGSYGLVAMLQSVVDYVVTAVGSNRLDSWFACSTDYRIDTQSRANVVKYSQKVLEEFACVMYNVSRVNNEFVREFNRCY